MMGEAGSVVARVYDDEPRALRVFFTSVSNPFGGKVQLVSVGSSCYKLMRRDESERQKHVPKTLSRTEDRSNTTGHDYHCSDQPSTMYSRLGAHCNGPSP